MPGISNKGKQMPASPIRRLVPYAEAAKKKGRKVYHLNIGQPDIPTPSVARNAVKNMKDEVIEYSHSAGMESYRRKLAAFYQGIGIHVDHTEMLVTTGGSEAISFALMSTINPGEEVIVPEPFYANYNGFSVAAGVKVVPITSSIDDGFALPSVEAFEKAISPKTRGIIVCNPSNPTGHLYSKEELERLSVIVRKYDLYLYSDEVYREFCYDGEVHFSAMNLPGLEQNVIMTDSVSKRYSMCGVRIGTMVSKNKELISTALKFAQARLSPPSYGQVAAAAALETPDSYFREVYEEYIERRNFMVAALNKMPGVKCPMPRGAFYTVVQLPVDDADHFTQWILSDFEYKNQTVMMAPASGFYSTPGLGKQEVRIAYVLKKDDLEKAMETLAEALKAYPGRTI
ncbi:MAG: aspartate aminotransferase [Bacteroidetes bacterium]|nr:MAG: aspartate aminotransferase [Bacteroidota bacterium]